VVGRGAVPVFFAMGCVDDVAGFEAARRGGEGTGGATLAQNDHI